MPGLSDDGEVQKLKTQLSQKTNEILQLQEDKEELELKLEDMKQQNQSLQQENRDGDANNTSPSNILRSQQSEEREVKNTRRDLNLSLEEDQHANLLQQIELSQQNAQEKDEEIEKMQKHNQELESKL